MKDLKGIISKNLIKLRKANKLTQIDLAEKLNYSDKTISKWENGESLPGIEILYELAEFYGITLNDLTSANGINLDHENKPKPKDKLLPTKLVITLLAVSAVFVCATVLFVCFHIIYGVGYGLVFFWAVPASCIVLIVFNSLWGKSDWLAPILSLIIWSFLACVHLQLIQYNLWIIYILGIPLQIAIILWGALITKKPVKKNKRLKQKDNKIESTNVEPKIKNETNILAATVPNHSDENIKQDTKNLNVIEDDGIEQHKSPISVDLTK